jgi:hypothetical protein
MKWIVAAVFASGVTVLATPPSQALAYWNDGNKLVDYCKTHDTLVAGYITGVIDSDKNYGTSISYCIPSNANVGQLLDTFCKFLKENPEQRHLPGSNLVRLTLVKAWPCSRKGDRQ